MVFEVVGLFCFPKAGVRAFVEDALLTVLHACLGSEAHSLTSKA